MRAQNPAGPMKLAGERSRAQPERVKVDLGTPSFLALLSLVGSLDLVTHLSAPAPLGGEPLTGGQPKYAGALEPAESATGEGPVLNVVAFGEAAPAELGLGEVVPPQDAPRDPPWGTPQGALPTIASQGPALAPFPASGGSGISRLSAPDRPEHGSVGREPLTVDAVARELNVSSVRAAAPIVLPGRDVGMDDRGAGNSQPFQATFVGVHPQGQSRVSTSTEGGTDGNFQNPEESSFPQREPPVGTGQERVLGLEVDSSKGATPERAGNEEPSQRAVRAMETPASSKGPGAKTEGRSQAAETPQAAPYQKRLGRVPEGELSETLSKHGGDGFAGIMQAERRSAPQGQLEVPEESIVKQARSLSRTLLEESLKRLPRTVEIKLDPPDLGKVTVLLSQRGQEVNVRFTAGTPEGQRILSSALEDLQRTLMENGLTLSSFSVDGEPSGSGRKNPEGSGSQRRNHRRLEAAAAARSYRPSGDNVLDVLA